MVDLPLYGIVNSFNVGIWDAFEQRPGRLDEKIDGMASAAAGERSGEKSQVIADEEGRDDLQRQELLEVEGWDAVDVGLVGDGSEAVPITILVVLGAAHRIPHIQHDRDAFAGDLLVESDVHELSEALRNGILCLV